ncbi:MAG: hypothetical protein AAF328_03600 [Planctomycetota bacterium]
MNGTKALMSMGLLCGLTLGLMVVSAGGQPSATATAAGTADASSDDPLQVAGVFSDSMVLQRERAVPVWGWAEPGTKITVRFADREARTLAGDDGRWMVTLPAMAASAEGRTLTVTADEHEQPFEDVLVGEVWLCGGQSNMQWPLRSTDNAEAFIANADLPNVRLFSVLPRVTSATPQRRLPHEQPGVNSTASWQACTPETAAGFSAVGYHFGRQLHEQLGVPVGLIASNWGGTRIESWTSRHALEATPEARPILEKFDAIAADWDNVLADWEARQTKPEYQTDPGDGDATTTRDWSTTIATANGPMDTPAGQTVAAPIAFANDFDGVAWLYAKPVIPDAWAGVPLTLGLGAIDDFDVAYVAGVEVGRTADENPQWWQADRQYPVPGHIVKPGPTLIAVRVFDRWQGGGLTGPPANLRLQPADGDLRGEPAIDLADGWTVREMHRQNPADITGSRTNQQPYGPGSHHQPAGLYNAMIHPLAPYALRGAVWYQGESNTGRAEQYRALMPAMIANWRDLWHDARAAGLGHPPTDGPGDPLWFGVVQLANFQAFSSEPKEDHWAELRDAQLHTVRHVARTGLAVTIDIGDADDIHPRNKHDVGDRLARWALTETYGRPDLVMAGPRFASAWFENEIAHLRFDTFGSPLTLRHAETDCTETEKTGESNTALAGFTIAGPDRVFHHARATITDKDRVELRSDAVPNPVAVRYAWQINPSDANLINEAGLPAGPFRTDDWPGLTTGKRVH